MIHGTVSLVAVTFFLLEHKQIKTSSLPSQQQTLSLKVTIVTMIKKPPSDLALLYNQFNNTSPEKNSDPVNVVNSKFYDTDQIQTLKFPDKHKSLALFHINA